jgi:hypothetical protein
MKKFLKFFAMISLVIGLSITMSSSILLEECASYTPDAPSGEGYPFTEIWYTYTADAADCENPSALFHINGGSNQLTYEKTSAMTCRIKFHVAVTQFTLNYQVYDTQGDCDPTLSYNKYIYTTF